MITFADVTMAPGGFLAWIVVGLIAGWLTGMVMGGGGYGFFADIVLGLIGALIGGFICGLFVHGAAGFWGTVVVAFIGAIVLVAIARMIGVSGRRMT